MSNTIETIQKNLAALTSETEKTLSDLSVKELRSICKSIGLSKVTQEDTVTPTYKARKASLVAAILTAIEPVKAQKVVANLPEETLTELHVTAKTIDTDTETDLGTLGEKTYLALRTAVQNLWNPETQRFNPPSLELVDIASHFSSDLLSRSNRDGEPLAASTLVNYKRMALNALETLLDADKNEWFYSHLLETYKSVLVPRINAFFASYRDARNQQDRIKLDERSENRLGVSLDNLLKWADDILSNLSVLPKTAWKDVSIALAVVTGRRMSELHSTAVFEPLDANHVLFTGQLKAKGAAADFYDENPSYPIPVLVGAQKALDGLQWLKDYEKTLESPNRVNKIYASDLTKHCKRVIAKHVTFVNPDGTTGEPKITYHKLRQFYALLAERDYKKPHQKTHRFLADILGHDRSGDVGTKGTTAQRYDADFYLV